MNVSQRYDTIKFYFRVVLQTETLDTKLSITNSIAFGHVHIGRL